jgi:peptidyl-prolyl cis-trans isomerase C
MLRFLALFLVCTISSSVTAAEEDVAVLSGSEEAVTLTDLERYVSVQIEQSVVDGGQPALDAASLARMAENLYILKVLAGEAAKMPQFDKEQAQWSAHIMYLRGVTNIYRSQYVQHMLKDVNWEATANEAYTAQKDLYRTKETVRVSHILVKIEPERTEAEALELAKDFRKRAMGEEDFAEIAKAHSEDPSVSRNAGDMGYFERGQMVKPFEDVAFAMTEPGAISEPVMSPFGFHILQFHSKKMPEQVPFEKVKRKIVEELRVQMAEKVWRDKLIAIRSDEGIKLDKELIEQLGEKYQAPDTPDE